MSTHVKELIMQNLKTTLEGIIAIGTAVADAGNSTPPDQLIVNTGGTYTHTAQTIYQIEIVTGGESGTAECTITDITNGDDDVFGNKTITSGTAIDLGTRGGTITFTMAAGEELTAGDIWVVTCDIYNNTVKDVFRATASGIELTEYPAIVLGTGRMQYQQVDGIKYVSALIVDVEGWIEERENVDTEITELQQDIENILALDTSRGGYALDTIYNRNDSGVPEIERPYGVISIEVEIRFHLVIGN